MLEDYENASRADLLAAVRRGRALREAVEGLADRLQTGDSLVHNDETRANRSTARRIRAVLAALDPS